MNVQGRMTYAGISPKYQGTKTVTLITAQENWKPEDQIKKCKGNRCH